MYNYDTVSEAVSGLRGRGFTIDFDAQFDCLECKDHKLRPDEFEIAEVYRFEGNSDPADEAIVYGIESKHGLKGILVNGYGPSSDELSDEMVRKLTMKYA
jgi:hypothetical protein